MAVIDSQGRLFGRVNLVDAILVLLLVAALPLAYAARVLFRDPPATLSQISPAAVNQGVEGLIELTGQHFRPYMRVSFGTAQAASFQFYGPTQAFVPVPAALERGTYDIVLFDHAREVARLPQALTVTGPPRPALVRIQLSGAFTGLTAEAVPKMVVGMPLNAADGSLLVIVTLGAPQPAVARVRVADTLVATSPVPDLLDIPSTVVLVCPTMVAGDGSLRCSVGGIPLVPDVHIAIHGPAGRQLFRVDRVDEVLKPEGMK